MSIKYKNHNWIVMTEDTVTQYDNICLPVFEKVTITIMRRVSETERKKKHKEKIKCGREFISYNELMKKLRV